MKIDSVVVNYQYYHNWGNVWWSGQSCDQVNTCGRNPDNNNINYGNPGNITCPNGNRFPCTITINSSRAGYDVIYQIQSSITLRSGCNAGITINNYYNLTTTQTFTIDKMLNINYQTVGANNGGREMRGRWHGLHTRNYYLRSSITNINHDVNTVVQYIKDTWGTIKDIDDIINTLSAKKSERTKLLGS